MADCYQALSSIFVLFWIVGQCASTFCNYQSTSAIVREYVFFLKIQKRDFFTSFCFASHVFSNYDQRYYWPSGWERGKKRGKWHDADAQGTVKRFLNCCGFQSVGRLIRSPHTSVGDVARSIQGAVQRRVAGNPGPARCGTDRINLLPVRLMFTVASAPGVPSPTAPIFGNVRRQSTNFGDVL